MKVTRFPLWPSFCFWLASSQWPSKPRSLETCFDMVVCISVICKVELVCQSLRSWKEDYWTLVLGSLCWLEVPFAIVPLSTPSEPHFCDFLETWPTYPFLGTLAGSCGYLLHFPLSRIFTAVFLVLLPPISLFSSWSLGCWIDALLAYAGASHTSS